jgi:hypothetical protein
MSLGVVHDACGDLVGITDFQGFLRLPINQEIELALEHVARLNSRMGMASGGTARRDFRDGGRPQQRPRSRQGGNRPVQRLIPSKAAMMPRWNSDQSKPSAIAR